MQFDCMGGHGKELYIHIKIGWTCFAVWINLSFKVWLTGRDIHNWMYSSIQLNFNHDINRNDQIIQKMLHYCWIFVLLFWFVYCCFMFALDLTNECEPFFNSFDKCTQLYFSQPLLLCIVVKNFNSFVDDLWTYLVIFL